MGSGGVAIAALPTVICLKVSFSDGLGGGKISELRRFEALPFKNKVIFTDKEYPEFRSAFCLKGIAKSKGGNKQVYQTANYVTAKRYIDQFDYVDFINQLRD